MFMKFTLLPIVFSIISIGYLRSACFSGRALFQKDFLNDFNKLQIRSACIYIVIFPQLKY